MFIVLPDVVIVTIAFDMVSYVRRYVGLEKGVGLCRRKKYVKG